MKALSPQPHPARTPENPIGGHSAGTRIAETPANRGSEKGTAVLKTGAPTRRLLDFRQAGEYLGISHRSVQGLVFRGFLPEVKIPCFRSADGAVMRRKLVDVRDLDAFIDANKEFSHD